MNADEIRACVSIPVRLNSPIYMREQTARGRKPGYALAFTIRIPASAKATMRSELDKGFGFTHKMMYPDYPGFASFGRSIPPLRLFTS